MGAMATQITSLTFPFDDVIMIGENAENSHLFHQ